MTDRNMFDGIKPYIEIMFADGRLETIKVKSRYLIPSIAKAVLNNHMHALCYLWVVQGDKKYQIAELQSDTCVNVVQTLYNDRLIF